MADPAIPVVLDETILRKRLAAFDADRAFFLGMWLENPQLAAQAGVRIRALLTPLNATAEVVAEPPATR